MQAKFVNLSFIVVLLTLFVLPSSADPPDKYRLTDLGDFGSTPDRQAFGHSITDDGGIVLKAQDNQGFWYVGLWLPEASWGLAPFTLHSLGRTTEPGELDELGTSTADAPFTDKVTINEIGRVALDIDFDAYLWDPLLLNPSNPVIADGLIQLAPGIDQSAAYDLTDDDPPHIIGFRVSDHTEFSCGDVERLALHFEPDELAALDADAALDMLRQRIETLRQQLRAAITPTTPGARDQRRVSA